MRTSERQTSDTIRTTARQKALLALFGLGLFVFLLVLAEGLLALLGLGAPRGDSDPFVGFAPGRALFTLEERPGGAVYATHPDKLAFFNHQEFPAEKKRGTYRVFALGGSTTAGRPYDSRVAFPRWLELYLQAMDPSRTYEVINAGAISYASYRIVVLMRELVSYEPDLFVIYTGHNEFLEERSYSEIIHQNTALKKLRFWLDGFRFYTLARQGWERWSPGGAGAARGDPSGPATILPAEVTARLDGWTGLDLYHRDDELARSIVEHFEYNLAQMVRIARRHDIDLISVVPASNVKDFSPFKSEHSAGLDAAQKAHYQELLESGREALASGRPDEARRSLERALEIDDAHAEAHFRLGRAAFELGEWQAARRSLIEAKDRDVAPLRALEALVGRVRSVMGGEHSVPLVDLPRLLEDDNERRHGYRLTGNEEFLDHVHPDLPVHSRIATELIEILVERGLVKRPKGWDDRVLDEIYRREIAALDRTYYAQRDLNLAKVLGWSGKLEEAEEPLLRAVEHLDQEPEVHLNLGIVYQRTGRLEQAREELTRAIELAPEMAEAHFNLGVVLGRAGDAEGGVRALRRALELRPDYPEARYNLGVLELERGDPEAAIASLEALLELKGGTGEIYARLGRAYRRAGRLDDAAASFRQQLELEPGSAAARLELGVTLARQGHDQEAAAWLESALSVDPENAAASYHLGRLASARGDRAAAIEHYRAALRREPRHADALNDLGIQLAASGDLESARQHLLAAIEAQPGHAEAHFNLGVVLDGAGRPRQAIGKIERAIELDPENGRFHHALAALYLAHGDRQRAADHLRRAEELGVEIPAELRRQILE